MGGSRWKKCGRVSSAGSSSSGVMVEHGAVGMGKHRVGGEMDGEGGALEKTWGDIRPLL